MSCWKISPEPGCSSLAEDLICFYTLQGLTGFMSFQRNFVKCQFQQMLTFHTFYFWLPARRRNLLHDTQVMCCYIHDLFEWWITFNMESGKPHGLTGWSCIHMYTHACVYGHDVLPGPRCWLVQCWAPDPRCVEAHPSAKSCSNCRCDKEMLGMSG